MYYVLDLGVDAFTGDDLMITVILKDADVLSGKIGWLNILSIAK